MEESPEDNTERNLVSSKKFVSEPLHESAKKKSRNLIMNQTKELV